MLTTLKRYSSRALLAIFNGLNALRRGLIKMTLPLLPAFRAIGRGLLFWMIRPLYRVVMMARLRLSKIGTSTRGLLFTLFTNRYTFHGVLLIITALSLYSQVQAKDALAIDAGKRFLLYTIVTDGNDALVEEHVDTETLTAHDTLLNEGVIEALPDIDYDYGDDIADLTAPGSIAALPAHELPEDQRPDVLVARTKTENYIVKEGDVIGTIARDFGVNVGTILWANNLKERSLIKPGMTLKIPPVSGILYTVVKNDTVEKLAKTYQISADDIRSMNALEGGLAVGTELILPGAKPLPVSSPIAIRTPTRTTTGKLKPDVPISRIRGKAVDVYQEISGKEDSREKPTDIVEDAPTTKLLWPTRLRQINQYWGWKHTGLDIEGHYDDPIYASEDGVVTTSGWNSGGYGLQIVIEHPNGMKTRYAHASKMYVKVGDKVKRGEVIAMVGTTGRSTGTHLHYEVYANGVRVNPLKYTK